MFAFAARRAGAFGFAVAQEPVGLTFVHALQGQTARPQGARCGRYREYRQAEQRGGRAVWQQPEGTGALWAWFRVARPCNSRHYCRGLLP